MSEHDRIERNLVLRAPRPRVWAALTEPAAMTQWYGHPVEIDLRLGGEIRFNWTGHGVFLGRVEVVEPPHRFAFRWPAHGTEPEQPVEAGPSTLVEFTLDEVPEGTRLTLVESGFAALPEAIRAASFADNSSGWDQVLATVAASLGESVPAGSVSA